MWDSLQSTWGLSNTDYGGHCVAVNHGYTCRIPISNVDGASRCINSYRLRIPNITSNAHFLYCLLTVAVSMISTLVHRGLVTYTSLFAES